MPPKGVEGVCFARAPQNLCMKSPKQETRRVVSNLPLRRGASVTLATAFK